MFIPDIDKITEEVIDLCYNSNDDIYCFQLENIDDLTQETTDKLNNKINLHNEVFICEIYDDCFYIKVHKYADTEYDREEM